jgi:hypothetical protein
LAVHADLALGVHQHLRPVQPKSPVMWLFTVRA